MHDRISVANELIDSCLKSGRLGLVYKLDFRKAFDTVSWSFMESLFVKMGFGFKWRSWLKTGWKTTTFAILVNGTPCDFFKSMRGLR